MKADNQTKTTYPHDVSLNGYFDEHTHRFVKKERSTIDLFRELFLCTWREHDKQVIGTGGTYTLYKCSRCNYQYEHHFCRDIDCGGHLLY